MFQAISSAVSLRIGARRQFVRRRMGFRPRVLTSAPTHAASTARFSLSGDAKAIWLMPVPQTCRRKRDSVIRGELRNPAFQVDRLTVKGQFLIMFRLRISPSYYLAIIAGGCDTSI